MLLLLIGLLVMTLVFVFIGLRVIAPTMIRQKHKLNSPGIDQMKLVDIGGIQQAVYIRGENIENPVILFLHGGPGNSMLPLLHMYQYEWEKEFTVVHWDQRNVGKTYLANDQEAVLQTMSAKRVLDDVHEVTEYVKQQLNKEKIILMGHSWGSLLGTMAVQSYPEDYSAYIGVAQVINMAENERVGYEQTLQAAKTAGNQKDVNALEAAAPYPPASYSSAYMDALMLVRNCQSRYGLSITMSVWDILRILTTPYYTSKELKHSYLFNPLKVFDYQGEIMRFLVEDADVNDYGTNYRVPVYYIMGENDYNSPYSVAKEFFETIKAPDKQMFSIPDAGHLLFLDNKEAFNRILLKEIATKAAINN